VAAQFHREQETSSGSATVSPPGLTEPTWGLRGARRRRLI